MSCSTLCKSTMRLIEFVNQLPTSWVLAPIYRKGAAMRSGKPATGKNPLEVAFDKDLGPADVALQLEKERESRCCWPVHWHPQWAGDSGCRQERLSSHSEMG